MRQDEWNEAILIWFLRGRPGERIYLRADDLELEKLNSQLGLAIERPADDLLDAVKGEAHGDASFAWLRGRSDEWYRRAEMNETPPFLAALAASVLIASRETDRGSLAFYQPFSRALGLREKISGEEYESTFRMWWLYLGRWLIDVNSGNRGLPSWMRIPDHGPRSIIGHPYTQVLLRREDLRDVESFLTSLGRFAPGDLTITDADAAGADLIDRFTRWALRRKVSARLWDMLFGEGRGNIDSLQSMLLDRLLNEIEELPLRPHERMTPLVITLDDWTDRQLRFSALITSAQNLEVTQIQIGGEQIGPLQVGEPHVVPLPVDAISLEQGLSFSVGDDFVLTFRPADIFILVAREWSLWCSVDDPEAGEMAYVLVSERALTGLLAAHRWMEAISIDRVPEGWRLFGPLELPQPDDPASAELPMRVEARGVPRLVGGLELARHAYLIGGPPGVWLPGGGPSVSVRVDGQLVKIEPEVSIVSLEVIDLGPGSHHVNVGPYRLDFEILTVGQLPVATGDLLRTAVGDVVSATRADGAGIFMGGVRIPAVDDYDPLVTCPLGERVVVLGNPGTACEYIPTMAPWAIVAGLPQALFEPKRPSSYPSGRFPFRPICWVAVQNQDTRTWTVTNVEERSGELEGSVLSPDLAHSVVKIIGLVPSVRTCDSRSEAQIASNWTSYAKSVLGEA